MKQSSIIKIKCFWWKIWDELFQWRPTCGNVFGKKLKLKKTKKKKKSEYFSKILGFDKPWEIFFEKSKALNEFNNKSTNLILKIFKQKIFNKSMPPMKLQKLYFFIKPSLGNIFRNIHCSKRRHHHQVNPSLGASKICLKWDIITPPWKPFDCVVQNAQNF